MWLIKDTQESGFQQFNKSNQCHLAIHAIFSLAQRGGREAATHLVYKYFAKTTDLCGEHSPRTAIRTTVLIRPLQFRYVRVPLDSIAKLCIRKDNIANVTCLMTYSHELQLCRYL